MSVNDKQLDSLLELIEQHIDLDHCRTVDERYCCALTCQDIDRPPLVVQSAFGRRWKLSAPWDQFEHFPYRQAFDDPAAMLQNMLLDRVVPGLILKDDNPLAIRNDHGTIQIASLLGGSWQMHESDYPWVKSLGSTEAVRTLIELDQEIDYNGGVLPQSTRTLEFYREKLDGYPDCRQAVQISLPDLQGPMDTADILWGSEIFLMLLQEPQLVGAFLDKIVRTMLALIEYYRKFSSDRLDPSANTQHGYNIPGQLLIRDDSSIMVSPDTYRQIIAPHDAELLEGVGGGSIHFCGNGQHLIEAMLEIPHLHGLDFGQPELMDISTIYAMCSPRKVALTNLTPSREDLTSGKAARDLPTGVVFVYHTEDIDDAREVVTAYRTSAAQA